MANDKLEDDFRPEVSDSAVRARNRTVMLTPEITGKVRARLSRANDMEERDTGSFGLPESDNVQQVDQNYEKANGEVEETIYMDSSVAAFPDNSRNLSSSQASNPISRENHEVSSSLNEDRSGRRSTASLTREPEPYTPQRREVPSSVNLKLGRPSEIESSLPNPDRSQFKPVFGGEEDLEESSVEEESFQEDVIIWSKITPVVGFLVSFDNDPHGQVLYIRSGRALVSSEVPNGGNFLFLNDESVSPMHAILRVTEDAQIQILDNLSEFGTTIVRAENGEEVALSGEKAMVQHGDLLRFGKRTFSVCLIGR